jgi:hypothetical protein
VRYLKRKDKSHILEKAKQNFEKFEATSGLLKTPISELITNLHHSRALKIQQDSDIPLPSPTKATAPNAVKKQLLTLKHMPKNFTEVLGDEEMNRNALLWLKSWDDIVFPEKKGCKPDRIRKKNKVLLGNEIEKPAETSGSFFGGSNNGNHSGNFIKQGGDWKKDGGGDYAKKWEGSKYGGGRESRYGKKGGGSTFGNFGNVLGTGLGTAAPAGGRPPYKRINPNTAWGQKNLFNELNIDVDTDKSTLNNKLALFAGPAGVGKTTLARIIAKHCGYNAIGNFFSGKPKKSMLLTSAPRTAS